MSDDATLEPIVTTTADVPLVAEAATDAPVDADASDTGIFPAADQSGSGESDPLDEEGDDEDWDGDEDE